MLGTGRGEAEVFGKVWRAGRKLTSLDWRRRSPVFTPRTA